MVDERRSGSHQGETPPSATGGRDRADHAQDHVGPHDHGHSHGHDHDHAHHGHEAHGHDHDASDTGCAPCSLAVPHDPALEREAAAHAHEHSHVHGLGGHGSANERRTFWAALITLSFMVLELVGGLISGSLALIADAAHMLTDAVSLAFAWYAFRLARRPADEARSYGFDRMQIVAAYTNGVAMLAVVAWIFFEAISRLISPEEVEAGTMLWVAIAGLGANIFAFFVLHGADRDNLNIRGAMLHVLGDLLGSVAAIAAALVILWTGWMPIDPLLSGLVGLLLLASSIRLVREAGHILLEGEPRHIRSQDIGLDIAGSVAGVTDVHHIHVWSLTNERSLLTMHVRIAPGASPEQVTRQIKARLMSQFGIDHATIEIEWADCADGDHPCHSPVTQP